MQGNWLLSLLVGSSTVISVTVEDISRHRHSTPGRLHSKLVHPARQRREFNQPMIAKRPLPPTKKIVAK